MGFEKLLDNLTSKRTDGFRRMMQSLAEYVLNPWFLDTCNLNQIWTMIVSIDFLSNSYLVCLILLKRDITFDNLLLPRSWSLFAL